MAHHHTSSILVIGYGNTLRSDDGVGPAIAQAVSEWQHPQIHTIICHQLTPELADPIAAASLVIFVDAIAHTEDSTPQTLLRSLTLNSPPSSAQTAPDITPDVTPDWVAHRCHPVTLLSLAQWLYHHTPTAWLIAVPAVSFAMGCEFSDTAIHEMQTALMMIETIINHSGLLDDNSSNSCTCYTTSQDVSNVVLNTAKDAALTPC